ncbi:MAG TPA: S1/P1 nuclease [Acidobacteriaceae bacterium]
MKPAIAALCILALVLSPMHAFAWSAEGHQAVAIIAENQLRNSGQFARISALLGDLSLADIAVCPDQVRQHERNHDFQLSAACQKVFPVPPTGTSNWHFINIPVALAKPSDADITKACGKACAIERINHFAGILADKTQPATIRLQALSFLVHFIGDIHQPLHCAIRDKDGGGNAEQIKFGRETTDLHAAWDNPLVASIDKDPAKLAADLAPEIQQASKEQSEGVNDWARESFAIARTDSYNGIPAAKGDQVVATLDPTNKDPKSYVPVAVKDIRLQIARGGVRLAAFIVANTPKPS